MGQFGLGLASSGSLSKHTSAGFGFPGGEVSQEAALPSQRPESGQGTAGAAAGSRSRSRSSRATSGVGDAGEGGEGGGRSKRESSAKDKQRGSNGKTSRELLLLDPKRVRRILANRMSAAKSKERKQQYTVQLTQMLDDSAAAREVLLRQEERLRRDSGALEAYLLETQREVTQLTAHLAAARQHGRLLMRQLQALRLEAQQDDAPPFVDLAAAEASAPPVRGWAELLTEALSKEDQEALNKAGMEPAGRQSLSLPGPMDVTRARAEAEALAAAELYGRAPASMRFVGMPGSGVEAIGLGLGASLVHGPAGAANEKYAA
ncbi:hypothetical protein GPECTOR_30g210 [Gonium pectorale]|uniref:BZIP domain-containing protein n=1 Tax=Gonium pectorale TaxID=33097 RepID=A0A150GEW6_GONPE|nr:hypothetical protein GPECTOR_30g210 [Gonium pectorale]|eukprot:KXZ48115.1 hypothetical protein GPECTOR_30g210 [Gonium pectorale]